MCIHRQKLLRKKVTSKFQTTLPHIHSQKSPRHILTHTHKGKISLVIYFANRCACVSVSVSVYACVCVCVCAYFFS